MDHRSSPSQLLIEILSFCFFFKNLSSIYSQYKYGLFVENYSANMLMDTFVKKNDYERAALAAHEVMLQESNQNEITLAACLFTCFKHLTDCKISTQQAKQEPDENEKPVFNSPRFI